MVVEPDSPDFGDLLHTGNADESVGPLRIEVTRQDDEPRAVSVSVVSRTGQDPGPIHTGIRQLRIAEGTEVHPDLLSSGPHETRLSPPQAPEMGQLPGTGNADSGPPRRRVQIAAHQTKSGLHTPARGLVWQSSDGVCSTEGTRTVGATSSLVYRHLHITAWASGPKGPRPGRRSASGPGGLLRAGRACPFAPGAPSVPPSDGGRSPPP